MQRIWATVLGMTQIEALIIDPDGDTRIEIIDSSWQSIKNLIDGWLEAVGGVLGEWIAYGDEEGRLKLLDPNPRAAALIVAAGGTPVPVVGRVVFVGTVPSGDEDGYTDGNVPQSLRDLAFSAGE